MADIAIKTDLGLFLAMDVGVPQCGHLAAIRITGELDTVPLMSHAR